MSNNLVLTVRDDRGKLVTRRRGHNIWLNTGRSWLANLITFTSFHPDMTGGILRPQFMGLGIGGRKQTYPAIANASPYSTHYPGTNLATDLDTSLTRLERPVRFGWTTGSPTVPTGTYPNLTYDPNDIFLKQCDSPPTHPGITSARFTCTIGQNDISSGPFTAVPLSEIGLFLHGNVNLYASSPIAYDTFDTLQKTSAFSIEVDWTVRF